MGTVLCGECFAFTQALFKASLNSGKFCSFGFRVNWHFFVALVRNDCVRRKSHLGFCVGVGLLNLREPSSHGSCVPPGSFQRERLP